MKKLQSFLFLVPSLLFCFIQTADSPFKQNKQPRASNATPLKELQVVGNSISPRQAEPHKLLLEARLKNPPSPAGQPIARRPRAHTENQENQLQQTPPQAPIHPPHLQHIARQLMFAQRLAGSTQEKQKTRFGF